MSLDISINKIEKILTTTSPISFVFQGLKGGLRKRFRIRIFCFSSLRIRHLMRNLTQRLPMYTKYNFDAIVILRSFDRVFCC